MQIGTKFKRFLSSSKRKRMRYPIQICSSFALILLMMASCVPQRKFQEVADKEKTCRQENQELVKTNEQLRIENNEALSKVEVSDRKMQALTSDTAVLGTSLRILRKQYDKINALNDELLAKTTSLREGTEADKRKLLGELDELKMALLAKEDALNQLEKSLNAKEEEILAREAKLDEMRSALNAKDSMMTALRRSVSDALLGFEGKGLSVEYRNGRVYVSMDAKLLLAVMEKRCGFKLASKDVFINIAGGLKVNDPSMDLAVVAAALSSSEDLSLPAHTCFAGEVGLSGEIRPVVRSEQRLAEAAKLGFKRMFISAFSAKELQAPKGIELIRVAKVQDMLSEMFG